MRKMWFIIAGLVVGSAPRSFADTAKIDAPPKVEESTSAADKAAVHDASTEADKWAGTKKEVPMTAQPAPVQSPVAATTPAPAKTPKPATTPAVHQTGLNEMHGKLESKGDDPQSLRLTVEGGYNVEFTYDAKTTIVNGGSPVTMDDLNYGDELIVRYMGKELNALEIDRVSKAPRPQ